jgi:hypothetical protein
MPSISPYTFIVVLFQIHKNNICRSCIEVSLFHVAAIFFTLYDAENFFPSSFSSPLLKRNEIEIAKKEQEPVGKI